jgi:ferrous iron transport protein B
MRNNHTRLENAITELATLLEKRFTGLNNARWVALRLLEGDQYIIEAVASGDLANLSDSPEMSLETSTELVER